MSEARFTPGPWKAVRVADSEKSAGIWHIDTEHGIGGDIATVWHYGDHENDAPLIGAAPDLYKTLADMTRLAIAHQISLGNDKSEHWTKRINEAVAVLSKARGDAQS